MVSQHGILLSCRPHLGPLRPPHSRKKVCDCLLHHGALPLQEIVRRVELSLGQVKSSLLVLIQHNCVQAFSSPRGGGDRTVTHYLNIFSNVLHRLRFSKFLFVIRTDIPEGEIQGNFNKRVYAHYVECCPKSEPFFDPLVDEQPTSARRRVQKTVEKVLSLEQKVVNTAALSDAERFSEIPYIMEGASDANDYPHHAVAGAKIIDTMILDKQIVHSTLYKLWKDDFIDTEGSKDETKLQNREHFDPSPH